MRPNFMRRRGSAGWLMLLLLGAPSLAQPLSDLSADQPVARVGDVDITAGQLLTDLIQRYAARTLADMVADVHLEALCAERGIAVSDEAVDETLRAARNRLPKDDYAAYLADMGGEERARRTIRRWALFDQLVADRIVPTEEEIEAFYAVAPVLTRPVETLGILVGAEQDAKMLLEGVLTKDNFAQFARDVSSHESAENGGSLGEVTQLDFPGSDAEYSEFLAAEEGAILGPIETDEGCWVLLRGRELPRRPAPLEAVHDSVVEGLRATKLAKLRLDWHRVVRAGRPPVVHMLGPLMALAGGPAPSPTDPLIPEGGAATGAGDEARTP